MPLTRTAAFTASGLSLMNRLSSMVETLPGVARHVLRTTMPPTLRARHSRETTVTSTPALEAGEILAERRVVSIELVQGMSEPSARVGGLILAGGGGLAQRREVLRHLRRVRVEARACRRRARGQ